MTAETIHTCSYYCERPGCIRAQRDELAARMTAETSNARGEWPERYACNGPEGTFWTDDAALANKLIGAAFDRDEWTVTDTQNPTGAAPSSTAETSNARGEWVLVPRNPTEAMIDAWRDAPDIWEDAYAAMLAAAPPPPSAPVGVEASYHPCTSVLIEGLKRLEGGSDVLAEWDRARAKADTALAQQPAAVECDCPAGRIDHASWCAVSKAQDAALAAQPGGAE